MIDEEALAPPRGARVPFRASSLLCCLLACATVLMACGRTDAPTTPPSTNGAAATTPTDAGSSKPDVDRAMAHLKALAADIGVRSSTSDGERNAAAYVKTQLEAAGYIATLESFEVDTPIRRTGGIELPDGSITIGTPFGGSLEGEATATVVFGEFGRAPELATVPSRGAVVLVNRGEVLFAEKAHAAQATGAAALVIANNQPGPLNGDLNTTGIIIPVLGVSQEGGQVLRALAGRTVTARSASTRLRGRSQNVFARPSAAPCTAYMGAHYDSVTLGPGAEDNASGVSLLLELARARRTDGVCVVAFGSEEVGLVGSQAFVRTHAVKGAQFMLNFDMVAKLTRPSFIGDKTLADRASAIALTHGLEIPYTASVGTNASSDHASFTGAGVPALMFYAGDDPFIHSGRDSFDNARRDDLARFLDIAAEVLAALTTR
ncbi:MAG: hypothetical protein DWI59_02320 [Chloroflexi bacterium]|nr:MAG: hypothetical protein DWI59_02320 [Chloroflexota bacterium]